MIRKIFIGFTLVAFLTVTFNLPIVKADELTDLGLDQAKIENIKASCTTLTASLNQLHASDGVLRVNRGQAYETVSKRLITVFNARVASNSLDGSSMVAIAANYDKALFAFKMDYKSYEDALKETIKTDCNKEPVEFYKHLKTAREARKKVHEDVLVLHAQLNDYGQTFRKFKKQILETK